MYNNNNNGNNNNRQLSLGQYKNFSSGQFQNHNKPHERSNLQNNKNTLQNSSYADIICNNCKKPGQLVRDCKVRPNNQTQTRVLGSDAVVKNPCLK